MIQDIKGVFHFLMVNIRHPFIIFWMIVIAFYIISLTLTFILGAEGVLFQASFPIYIFCAVVGLWLVKNTVPYLIKLGVTRKLIFLSYGLFFILLAIVQSVLANFLMRFTTLTGKTAIGGHVFFESGSTDASFAFYHLSQFLPKDIFLTQVIVDVIVCFAGLSLTFLIGLIFYRYGLVGGFSFLATLFLLFIGSIAKGYFVDLVKYIVNNYTLTIYFALFGCSVVIYAISYFFLRRLTIHSA